MLSPFSQFFTHEVSIYFGRVLGNLALLQALESGGMRGLQMCQIVGWKFLGHIVQLFLLFESLSLVCHSLAWSSQRMVANVCVCAVVGFRSHHCPRGQTLNEDNTLNLHVTPPLRKASML
jgi:hypothetical protein